MKRLLIVPIAILAVTAAAFAQDVEDTIAVPTLRANVTVTGDIVRIGDMIENAGPAAQIAIYRAPDLGTTGVLPADQVIATLRSHRVIGVDTRDIREVSVTRASRIIGIKDIERAVLDTLERRNGLGDATDIQLTFDRDVRSMQLDATSTGEPQAIAVRYDPRTTRFDVTFEIGNKTGALPAKLRFTGTAIETVQTALVTRNIDRGEVLKASDIVTERRPKSEAGTDLALRDRSIGMQARKPIRAGQPIRGADLAKPDLVTRDQSVTLIYNAPGIYLTVRGKAVDGGTEGDVVTVTNLQSKRTVQGTVVGPGQVMIAAPSPRLVAAAPQTDAAPTETIGSVTTGSSAASKVE
ncbi:MAG: flagellar biosynthesis protein FlgA [Proteobacteria bacterium SG_bin9]|nr:MAG: flagellar biosynthesis protein FlgA [Proteobacteria bacterium SG_bin9]